MLGRKNYTREEVDHAQAAIDQQLVAYRELVGAMGGVKADQKLDAARDAFEARFVNNLVLVLDRYFVHRIRAVTGKDGNALNEVELLTESLISNDGVMRANNVIKLVPDQSITKVQFGEPIKLTLDQFERLSAAFFAELESKFL